MCAGSDAGFATRVVGPSVHGDVGAHPVSLVFEAACRAAATAVRAEERQGSDVRFVVTRTEMSFAVADPWESCPEMLSHAWETLPGQLSVATSLHVAGADAGRILTHGWASSPGLR